MPSTKITRANTEKQRAFGKIVVLPDDDGSGGGDGDCGIDK